MVIVVEESTPLRAEMASTLREDGHEVIELSDGAQLLARLMSHVALLGRGRDSIAVVASPQASVFAVLSMLRSARWVTPVVLLANELARDEPPRVAEREIDPVATLRKPVDMDALRAAVAEAMAESRTRAGRTTPAG
jgi:DNA-binding response OmpR family regulator